MIDTFRIAAEEAVRIGGEVQTLDISPRARGYQGIWKRVPIGPCSFISPFNFPLNLAAHKIAPALANLKKAVQKDPNYADAHFNLGVLYRMTRRPAEAKRELETALNLDPKNSKAWGHLGFIFAQLGDARESERCFRKALELDPSDTIIADSLQELLQKTQ